MFRFVIPPVLVLMLLGGMLLVDRMLPTPEVVKPPFTWLGSVGVLLGLVIAQGHARLFRASGMNIQTFGEPSGLCERGLFSRSRNPMYLGMLVLLSGAALWMGSLAAFAGPLAFFFAARFWYILYEEARMKDKYGTRYDDYCRRVPRWLALRAKVQRHSTE